MNWEGSGCDVIELLLHYLPGETEENHKESGQDSQCSN
jgi:hypothetical protein